METSQRTNRADLKLNTKIVRDLLVRFIKDQTLNAGFTKAVIGISGGVDSAVSATLAAEALGKENVLGVMIHIVRVILRVLKMRSLSFKQPAFDRK